MSGILGVRMFRNDAVELIKGISSDDYFGRKPGLQENHICPEISPIYKVFIVPKNLDERPRCIFYSLSNKEATRFYYDEAMKNKRDDQNIALIKFSHPAVTGFLNDVPSVAQRINKVDAWIKEHGEINAEYEQQILEHTFSAMDTLHQIELLLGEALNSISNIEPAIYDNDDGYALIMARNAQEKIEAVLNYIRDNKES